MQNLLLTFLCPNYLRFHVQLKVLLENSVFAGALLILNSFFVIYNLEKDLPPDATETVDVSNLANNLLTYLLS